MDPVNVRSHTFRAWLHSGLLTAAPLLVLAVLAAETDAQAPNEVYTSAPYLARLTRKSLSATRRALEQLSKRGAIKCVQRGTRYKLSRWRILEPPL